VHTEQCNCGNCGKQTTVIGYEETEVLDVRPAEYFVRVIKREKRACRDCESRSAYGAGAGAHLPKSVLSDQVIIEALVAVCASLRFIVSRPSSARRRRPDRAIDAQRWGAAGRRVTDANRGGDEREVLAGTYIQADETPIGVQTP